jgi:G:T/U-mismatch repair DNA glycosylase
MASKKVTKHKFIAELEEYEQKPLTGNFNILVIGTFNPAIEKNKANWFYGRSESEFWYLLPKALNFDSLYPSDIGVKIEDVHTKQKAFCKEQKIVIVDVFKKVNIEVAGYRDNELHTLKENEFEGFDYKKAFGKANFKLVAFTWKSDTKSHTQNKIRESIIAFFTGKGVPCLVLDSPSPSHQIGRYDKLTNWQESFKPYLDRLKLVKPKLDI